MSVLIKGLIMPSCCDGCTFSDWSNLHQTASCKLHDYDPCFADHSREYENKRADFCPLVEIPEPHGDLIDRDAPEIVRCSECRHRDPEDKKCDCGHDIIWQLPRDDDWYCADAERRTDGT